MSTNLTALALKWLPTAAEGLSVTPDASAWLASAWVELSASTPGDWTLYGLHVEHPKIAVEFEVDVGVGAAGAEVVVTTFRSVLEASSTFLENKPLILGIPVAGLVPSGSRVALRLRKQGTSVLAWLLSLGYYEGAIGATNVTDAPQKTMPRQADGYTVSNIALSLPWVKGLWVDFWSNPTLITSEIVIASIRGLIGGNCSPFTQMLAVPYFIPSRSRLAMRISGTSATFSASVAALYHETVGGFFLTGFAIDRPGSNEWELEVGFVDGGGSDPCEDGVLGPLAWVEWQRRIPE